MVAMKAKRHNPEKIFGDALMKAWAMMTGGWFYRIPDARHLRGSVPYSHPRPADYIATCKLFSALVETKWIGKSKSVKPWDTLTKSQRGTIESIRGTVLRYYVVIGTTCGAFVFDGHDMLCMKKRWTLHDTCPVSWYPSVGFAEFDQSPDMLE